MIRILKKKSTEYEHLHYEVYHNNIYLGYFMANNYEKRACKENWNFCSKHSSIQYFHAETKKELLNTLNNQILGREILLKQHFGITKLMDKKKIKWPENTEIF